VCPTTQNKTQTLSTCKETLVNITMVNVVLIIACVVAFVVLAIAGVYLLVYYSHPDDKNDAYVPKFTVITGFMLAGITVLLFPLDVANNEGYAGEFV
jgi:LMBR1 domain-containing protein 1